MKMIEVTRRASTSVSRDHWYLPTSTGSVYTYMRVLKTLTGNFYCAQFNRNLAFTFDLIIQRLPFKILNFLLIQVLQVFF